MDLTARPQAASAASLIPHLDFSSALTRLHDHVEGLQSEYRALKPKLDHITKELAALGFKPGDAVDDSRLPIDEALIDTVVEALKDGGKNVKSLQKALGIFDYVELTRKRKALSTAGITRETENYQGTNATFVELNPDFTSTAQDEQIEPGGEAAPDQEEDVTTVEPATVKAATTKPKTPK
jgi:hypothetical protein